MGEQGGERGWEGDGGAGGGGEQKRRLGETAEGDGEKKGGGVHEQLRELGDGS